MDSCELLSPPFKLETPGGVQSVAWRSWNTQAPIKGSDQTAQADLRLCWSHISHCWKSHALAHILSLRMRMEGIDSFGTRENTQAEISGILPQ